MKLVEQDGLKPVRDGSVYSGLVEKLSVVVPEPPQIRRFGIIDVAVGRRVRQSATTVEIFGLGVQPQNWPVCFE